MTCLIDIALGGPRRVGVYSYTCKLGTFFCYSPDITHANFCKKISAGSSGKIWQKSGRTERVIFNYVILIPKLWLICPQLSAEVHIYKKSPQQHRSMRLHPCAAKNSVYQASHFSTLLIGWTQVLFLLVGNNCGFFTIIFIITTYQLNFLSISRLF